MNEEKQQGETLRDSIIKAMRVFRPVTLADLEEGPKPAPVIDAKLPPVVDTKNIWGEFTKSQLVLLFWYFFKHNGLEPRVNIDVSPIAKFIHLIVGKEFDNASNSDYYKMLKKAPNFKNSEKSLIEDLEKIKKHFESVQLIDIANYIGDEIVMARKEAKIKGRK